MASYPGLAQHHLYTSALLSQERATRMSLAKDGAIFAQDGSFSFFDAVLEGFSISEEETCADDAPTDVMEEEEFIRAYEAAYGPPSVPADSLVFTAHKNIEHTYNPLHGTSLLSTPPSSAPPSHPASPPPPSTHAVGPSPSPTPPNESRGPASPAPDQPPTRSKLTKNQLKNREKMHERRREKRKLEREASLAADQAPPSATAANHLKHSAEVKTEYETADIPSGSTGYKALPDTSGRVYRVDELVDGLGFTLVKADGNGAARPIVDKNGLVIAVVVGHPRDKGWTDVHTDAHNLLMAAGESCRVSPQSRRHRRGTFLALNAGISFGGGQKAPGNLVHSPHNAAEVQALLTSKSFTRIARFCSSAFATWAPNLYEHYRSSFRNLLDSNINLKRNFEGSVWAAAAFNCGPQTTCARHRDFANLPFGWCSVTALGEFDHELGGHVVLWEAKLVIELPPGHTILLPSAAIGHSNTPIRPGETRTSFTQYSAGGVFRWAEHGFQTETKYRAGMSAEELAQVAAANLARTKMGLKLFSKLSDLRQLQASGQGSEPPTFT